MKRRKNPVWLVPIAIVGGLAAMGALGYAAGKRRAEKRQAPGTTDKNFYVVTSRDTSAPVVAGVAKGGAWLLVVPDAAHEAGLRTYLADLAKANRNVNFVLFSHRMRETNKIPFGAWGGAEGIVDRQSLGIVELRGEGWKSAITSKLDEVISASQNLGALPATGVLDVVGIV